MGQGWSRLSEARASIVLVRSHVPLMPPAWSRLPKSSQLADRCWPDAVGADRHRPRRLDVQGINIISPTLTCSVLWPRELTV